MRVSSNMRSAGLFICFALLLVLTAPGCSRRLAFVQNPPFIPVSHYNCYEATPDELANAYFNNCVDIRLAQNKYDGQYFVFKNLEVRDWMVADVSRGWLWTGSGIKCMLANAGEMKNFKLGDTVDVVGLNSGVNENAVTQLVFKDCYAMRAGSVQLPAGEGQAFMPTY